MKKKKVKLRVKLRFRRLDSCSIDPQAEKSRRMLYLRGREVVAQRERAADMKRRNGALIYNILPPHVAAYFLSRARHHDDLYSQSYAEVGVLFASMPNFADFYSEESINNQGLECLRFLNEVISDFDAVSENRFRKSSFVASFQENSLPLLFPRFQILDQNKFKDIIKIKTIGSTYMAASGITESAESEEAPRWGHLSTLVEFALELKKALSSINEQSFNHFVLKMGINHGPVTAGVIGARKPHYDIWGNTVNVASRMESTGKVGCIQVRNLPPIFPPETNFETNVEIVNPGHGRDPQDPRAVRLRLRAARPGVRQG